tara:strand:- start:4497 stop:5012 length:516 start_codon:yes stop_codon:yes gene_type:complete
MVSPNNYIDENGFYHIEWVGLKYFTIQNDMSKLIPEYYINGVPLVGVGYDSDTWLLFDEITFHVPIYNMFGNTNTWDQPISVGNDTITLDNIAQNHAPLNIVGYQINKSVCYTCPVPTFGTSTRYSYKGRKMVYLRESMVGDTLMVVVDSWWNIDLGDSFHQEDILNIVVD